jgi:ClpP class serine protease
MSLVGAVGAALYLVDTSGLFAKQGLRALPISSDGALLKSVGAPGVAVTKEHEQYVRSIVDAFGANFRDAVRTGRRLSESQLAAVFDRRGFRRT